MTRITADVGFRKCRRNHVSTIGRKAAETLWQYGPRRNVSIGIEGVHDTQCSLGLPNDIKVKEERRKTFENRPSEAGFCFTGTASAAVSTTMAFYIVGNKTKRAQENSTKSFTRTVQQ